MFSEGYSRVFQKNWYDEFRKKMETRQNETHPGRCQKTTCNLLLGSHNHSVLGQNSYARPGVIDGFNGIFNLMQTSLWREGRCGGVVSTGHGDSTILFCLKWDVSRDVIVYNQAAGSKMGDGSMI
mmetsp:Transcript_8102/g.16132  ORF Transcript_8102/g.16132 Transcript_8102/m.16132 type:complete len:125 (+) Transcript_8102:911-1285(+)